MGRPSPRFLPTDEIRRAIVEVLALASPAGVRVVLIGGAAMQHYGSSRRTTNVDFATAAAIGGLAEGDPLAFGGYASTAPCGVPVNIVVRSDKYAGLYAQAVATAMQVASLAAPVVRPEELAAMKMVAARDRDAIDFDHLIRAGVANLDRAVTLIEEHLGSYGAEVFARRVERVEWQKHRERGR